MVPGSELNIPQARADRDHEGEEEDTEVVAVEVALEVVGEEDVAVDLSILMTDVTSVESLDTMPTTAQDHLAHEGVGAATANPQDIQGIHKVHRFR